MIGWVATVLHGDFFVFDRWWWIRKRLRPGPIRTLDAGSGSGAFAMYAAKLGNRAIGLSFNPRNNVVAARRAELLGISSIEFRQADLRHLDEMADQLGRFEQIICLETVEHLKDDMKFVGDLGALLAPGGRLLLTTPNLHHKPLYGELAAHSFGPEDGSHVRFGYEHHELERLFDAAGLKVVDQGYVGGILSQWFSSLYGWLMIRAKLPITVAWALTFPLRALFPLDGPLTRLMDREFVSLAVVAEQPHG